jgi:hypothetical protein
LASLPRYPLAAKRELKPAALKCSEDAVVFGSGYLTNFGVIAGLAGHGLARSLGTQQRTGHRSQSGSIAPAMDRLGRLLLRTVVRGDR